MERYLKFLAPVLIVTFLLIGTYAFKVFNDDNSLEETQNLLSEQQNVEEGFQTEIPDEFPEDFPVYLNSQIKDSWRAEEEAILGMSVVWTSEDSIADINSFYKQELPNMNWEYEEISNTEKSFTMTIEKEDIMGFIGVTEEEGQRVISVTLGVEN